MGLQYSLISAMMTVSKDTERKIFDLTEAYF